MTLSICLSADCCSVLERTRAIDSVFLLREEAMLSLTLPPVGEGVDPELGEVCILY